MPMSGLDPSMLNGLCRDEAEWVDFKRRVAELPWTIQDESPSWLSDSDDNMGLESISDPEDLCLEDEDGCEESKGEKDECQHLQEQYGRRSRCGLTVMPKICPDASATTYCVIRYEQIIS